MCQALISKEVVTYRCSEKTIVIAHAYLQGVKSCAVRHHSQVTARIINRCHGLKSLKEALWAQNLSKWHLQDAVRPVLVYTIGFTCNSLCLNNRIYKFDIYNRHIGSCLAACEDPEIHIFMEVSFQRLCYVSVAHQLHCQVLQENRTCPSLGSFAERFRASLRPPSLNT